MAHESFPMFKLCTLIARQITSPVANKIKDLAIKHPFFNQKVCVNLAWWYTYGEAHCRMMVLRLAGTMSLASTHVPPPHISPEEAQSLGSTLLGEVIVFTIGASIIIFEMNRQAAIKEEVEKDKLETWNNLKNTIDELNNEVARQDALIRMAKEYLAELQNKKHQDQKTKTSKLKRPKMGKK